jgi:hypothetical protein
MPREVDRETLNRILSQQPGAYKGHPEDTLTCAEGGVVSEPYSEPWLLAAENERYWEGVKGMVPDRPTDTSDFAHPMVRPFLEATGAQRQADALGVQQGGRFVAVPGPDGRLKAVSRERVLAQQREAAINLAKAPRVLSIAEQADLELRQARAGGWLLSDDERSRLYGAGGDPAAEMTAGW